MKTNELENKTSLYRDVSRITLEGLAKITREFESFYQELSVKFQPALEGMAQKELPEASDQLNAIVEATETARFQNYGRSGRNAERSGKNQGRLEYHQGCAKYVRGQPGRFGWRGWCFR